MVNPTALLCACQKSSLITFCDPFYLFYSVVVRWCWFFFLHIFSRFMGHKPHLVVCSLLNRNKTRCGANGNETTLQENCKMIVSIKRGRHTASNNEQNTLQGELFEALKNKMCKHYNYTDMNTTSILKHLKG